MIPKSKMKRRFFFKGFNGYLPEEKLPILDTNSWQDPSINCHTYGMDNVDEDATDQSGDEEKNIDYEIDAEDSKTAQSESGNENQDSAAVPSESFTYRTYDIRESLKYLGTNIKKRQIYAGFIFIPVVFGCFLTKTQFVVTSVAGDIIDSIYGEGVSSIYLLIFYWIYGLLQILVGFVADKLGLRWTFTISYILTFIGCVFIGYAPSLILLYVGRGISAVGCSMYFVTATKWIAVWWHPRTVTIVVAILLLLTQFGCYFGTTPLKSIIKLIGFDELYRICSYISLVFAFISFFSITDSPKIFGFIEVEDEIRVCDYKKSLDEPSGIRKHSRFSFSNSTGKQKTEGLEKERMEDEKPRLVNLILHESINDLQIDVVVSVNDDQSDVDCNGEKQLKKEEDSQASSLSQNEEQQDIVVIHNVNSSGAIDSINTNDTKSVHEDGKHHLMYNKNLKQVSTSKELYESIMDKPQDYNVNLTDFSYKNLFKVIKKKNVASFSKQVNSVFRDAENRKHIILISVAQFMVVGLYIALQGGILKSTTVVIIPDVNEENADLVQSLFNIISLLGAVTSFLFNDYIGRKASQIMVSGITAISVALMIIFTTIRGNIYLYYVISSVVGYFGIIGLGAAISHITDKIDRSISGFVMGLFNMMMFIGGAVFTQITKPLSEPSKIKYAYVIYFICTILSIVLLSFTKEIVPRKSCRRKRNN